MNSANWRWNSGALFLASAILFLTVDCASAGASQFVAPVQTESTLKAALCLQGCCDEQVESLRGHVTLFSDCDDVLTQIGLVDYRLEAAENIQFELDCGPFGSVTATVRDLILVHPDPFSNQSVPVSEGQFIFPDVSFKASGIVTYQIKGPICEVLKLPCNGRIDLSELEDNSVMDLSGSLWTTNGTNYFSLRYPFFVPFNASQPGAGGLTGEAIVALAQTWLRLSISRVGNQHVLRWPSAAPGFRLYRTADLSPPIQWEPVGIEPYEEFDGCSWNTVAIPDSNGQAFYRLALP
jgi:hypothetical protein